jgi:hypothetical protein
MKKFFITALLLASLTFQAQTVNDIPLKDINVEYIEIVGYSKFMSTKLKVALDFGQHTKMFSSGKETLLKDADGKVVEFNSMIDALNFMSENGYDFTTAYTVTDGDENIYHYILRKRK